MSRVYAQLASLVFAVVAVGGLFLGDASHVVNGVAQGNLGNLTLHFTYTHDVINLVFLVGFVYVGFFATRVRGKVMVLCAGIVLLGLGIGGFIHGDDALASRSIAGFNFPTLVNVFDTFWGVLAILAGLGTLSDAEISASENRSLLREG